MLKSGQTLLTRTSHVNNDKNKRFTVVVVPSGKNKIKVECSSYIIDFIKRLKRPLLIIDFFKYLNVKIYIYIMLPFLSQNALWTCYQQFVDNRRQFIIPDESKI